jgi:hypothetical protein
MSRMRTTTARLCLCSGSSDFSNLASTVPGIKVSFISVASYLTMHTCKGRSTKRVNDMVKFKVYQVVLRDYCHRLNLTKGQDERVGKCIQHAIQISHDGFG